MVIDERLEFGSAFPCHFARWEIGFIRNHPANRGLPRPVRAKQKIEKGKTIELVICKSLCSWVHDGSHYAHDDLYVSIGDTMVGNYLRVFREIFEKQEHHAHYKMMMMSDDYVESPVQRLV